MNENHLTGSCGQRQRNASQNLEAATNTPLQKTGGDFAMQERTSFRFMRGLEMLNRIDGKAGANVLASLEDIAPDFGQYLLEFPFGDIYSRPGLGLKKREIATVAALTAMGNAGAQLRVHIEAALNVGCSRVEVVEVIMQMAVYAGFPAALNGLFAAKEVFANLDKTS